MNKKLLLSCVTAFWMMILLGPAPGISADNLKKIAVFPFDVHSTSPGQAASLGETVNRGVSSELLKSKAIRLVPRAEISAGIKGKPMNDALLKKSPRGYFGRPF